MTKRNRRKARRRANRLRRQNAVPPAVKPMEPAEPMWTKIALVWLGVLVLGGIAWLLAR